MILTPCPSHSLDASFPDNCSVSQLTSKHMFLLLNLLDIQLFSQTVTLEQENITENLCESPFAQNICRKLVPFIQSFLFYRNEFKDVYASLCRSNIHLKLATLKFYTVQNLQNIYRSKNDPSMYVTVSNKTCFETANRSSIYWKYFCRQSINEKDIIKVRKYFTVNQFYYYHIICIFVTLSLWNLDECTNILTN